MGSDFHGTRLRETDINQPLVIHQIASWRVTEVALDSHTQTIREFPQRLHAPCRTSTSDFYGVFSLTECHEYLTPIISFFVHLFFSFIFIFCAVLNEV